MAAFEVCAAITATGRSAIRRPGHGCIRASCLADEAAAVAGGRTGVLKPGYSGCARRSGLRRDADGPPTRTRDLDDWTMSRATKRPGAWLTGTRRASGISVLARRGRPQSPRSSPKLQTLAIFFVLYRSVAGSFCFRPAARRGPDSRHRTRSIKIHVAKTPDNDGDGWVQYRAVVTGIEHSHRPMAISIIGRRR